MITDRWKACGRRTNRQRRKENKGWKIIIIRRNNNKIMKKQNKTQINYPFWYNLHIQCINVTMANLTLVVVLI